jgi:hypothetical protein
MNEHATAPQNPNTVPLPIWNPGAAACWSLLLSPIFGSILHMKNWHALGESTRAETSKRWAIGSTIFFLLVFLSGLVAPDSKLLDGLSKLFSVILLVAWYYAIGKSQQFYVLARFGKNYPRRGWAKPLLFALLVFVAFLVVAGLVGFVIGAAAGAA